MTEHNHNHLGLSYLALVAAMFYLALQVVLPASRKMTHGFIGYYSASRLAIEKNWGPQVYTNEWFINYVYGFTNGEIGEIIRPNLPTVSLMTLPLANFSPSVARSVWLGFNYVLLGASFGLLLIIMCRIAGKRYPERSWIFLLSSAVFFPPLIRNFTLGQAYILVLFLCILWVYSLVEHQEWLAGLFLGIAFSLKTYGLYLWILPFIKKSWKTLLWLAGTFFAFLVVSLPLTTINTWLAYPHILVETLADPVATVTAYQSLPGFVGHLFRFDQEWNPTPTANIPLLASLLQWILAGCAITLTAIRAARVPNYLTAAGLIALNTFLTPLSQEHHYVLMLLPVLLLVADAARFPLQQPRVWVELGVGLSAILLLTLPFPYKDGSQYPGILAILAYPRLLGGVLVWGIVIWRMDLRIRSQNILSVNS